MTLSEFILANMEAILQEWEAFAATIPSAAEMNSGALRDEALELLDVIARDIVQPQSAEEQKAKSEGVRARRDYAVAAQHAVGRRARGFNLNEIVSEYRALRASVIRLWTREMTSADGDALDELTRFNEAIDEALTESIARYMQELDRSRQLFLGVLGHDLRTPLGAVLNSAQYLLYSDGLSGAQMKAVSAILRSGTRVRGMISDLLDVTRTRLGQSLPMWKQETDFAVLCEQVVDEARAYHPDSAIVCHRPGELLGCWDDARLRQMLGNLVENAIEHGLPDQPVTVSATGDAEHLVLRVHNEGAPISQSDRRMIFEPLTRGQPGQGNEKKVGGLGLGLYIARLIAEAHGGSIEVESTKKTGTTFAVVLPRRSS